MQLGNNQIVAIGTVNGVQCSDTISWNCDNSNPGTTVPTIPDVPVGQIQINFQKTSAALNGYLIDNGSVYADRGNGYSYGWNANLTANTRERNVAADKRFDTFMQLQSTANSSWSIALPNQWYKVSLASGDPSYTDSNDKIEANGVVVIDFQPNNVNKYGVGTAYIKVTNGTVVVKPSTTATNAKLDFIHITPVTETEALSTGIKEIKKKR